MIHEGGISPQDQTKGQIIMKTSSQEMKNTIHKILEKYSKLNQFTRSEDFYLRLEKDTNWPITLLILNSEPIYTHTK